MSDTKISQDPSASPLASTAIIPIVQDGTNKKTTVADVVAGLLDETAHDLLDHTGLAGIPAAYTLPTASTTVLGGVKVDGTTVTISNGVISSSGSGMTNPMTTAGDIIYGGTDGAPTRLAKGTDGQVLTLASGLPAWAAASGGGSTTLTIDNKTTAYTVVAGDNGKVINCTSGTFTVSLTAAATLGAGFNVWIINSGTGTITIDPNGSEAIDGDTSSVALAQGAAIRLFCDGTGFRCIAVGHSGGTRGLNNVQLGSGARATGNSGAVALGLSATASGIKAFATTGCTASSNYATAIAHNSNGDASQAVSGAGAMALGGSYASGVDSFAAAIGSNSSNYGAKGSNSIAIGKQALALLAATCAIGVSTEATGSESVAIGNTAKATGSNSYAIGLFVTASNNNSMCLGYNALSAIKGKFAYGACGSLAQGSIQTGILVLFFTTTGDTQTALTSTGGAAAADNQVILPNSSLYRFRAEIQGMQKASDGTNCAGYTIEGLIRRGANAAATAIQGSIVKTVLYESDASWDVTAEADTTNGGLAIKVTGKAATNIRWNATVYTTELTYA